MINPGMLLSPAGQPGVMGPTQDALNGAYSGAYATVDPNTMQPAPQNLGGVAIPSISQPPSIASPAFVSPQIFGVGGPVTIMGTPTNIGPASQLSGQATAGDAGVMSGMGVGQLISAGDPGLAAAMSSDPGTAVAAAAAAAPAPAPAS